MSATSKIQSLSRDLVRVAPEHYRVEFENERARVFRVRYAPHEKSGMQEYPCLIEINLTVAHLLFNYPDGRTETVEARAGQVLSFPASERSPENLSDFPYEAIAIEWK
jgi:beta-alanine degradation protein BauB